MININIKIPTLKEVLERSISVKVCEDNESWFMAQLGSYAKRSGVYIHHNAVGDCLYVGQTSKNDQWGTFQVRLRRECQPKAASYSNLYQLLRKNGPVVKTTMYDLAEIRDMFEGSVVEKLKPIRLALILEQFMIAAYDPKGNIK